MKIFSRKYILLIIVCLLILCIGYYIAKKNTAEHLILSPYPYGKNFAFTITDDPDGNNLENLRVVYDYLSKIGLKTTIALWVEDASRTSGLPDKPEQLEWGDSCSRKDYRQYMQELQKRGFEIALHTVTSGNDLRESTIKGYEKFKQYFGSYPKINIMHADNLDNIYWGEKIASNPLLQKLITLLSQKATLPFGGEETTSKYFWGDICKEKTKYIRLWGTSDINTLKFNPSMPYHDPKKPFVNYWFSFTYGNFVDDFTNLISEKNIERLINERGVSIVYTHFNHDFVVDGVLNKMFKQRITSLSNKDGWFVPASTILDRLLLTKRISIESSEKMIVVTNNNDKNIVGLTLILDPDRSYRLNGDMVKTNSEGEIIIDQISPRNSIVIFKDEMTVPHVKEYPDFFREYQFICTKDHTIF